MLSRILFLVPVICLAFGMDSSMYKTVIGFRECFTKKYIGVCLKERSLRVLDETMLSEKPISFFEMIDVEKNPKYLFNNTPSAENDTWPEDFGARNLQLNSVLQEKIEQFFKSRVFKFNMAPAFEEGRAKKDKGGGKGNMMMLAMGGMACMMAQMYMGKVAFLAGTALILAKVALFLSAIAGLKKLSGGGGGGGTETAHVVYATEGHSHGGGGGGGWHRSLEGDAHNMVYKGQSQDYGY